MKRPCNIITIWLVRAKRETDVSSEFSVVQTDDKRFVVPGKTIYIM